MMQATHHDRHLRAWAVVILCLFLGLIAIWRGTEYLVAADKYRPYVEGAIRNVTGLNAAVGHLSFSLLPVPNIVAYDIIVGDDTLKISASRAQAWLRFASLFRRKVDITSVALSGLAIAAPADTKTLAARVKEAAAARSGADARNKATGEHGAPLGFSVNIEHVHGENAAFYMGDTATPFLVFSFGVQNILSENASVSIASRLPSWGANAQLEANLTVNPHSGPSVRGELDLTRMDASEVLRRPWLPDVLVDVHAELNGDTLGYIAAGLSGSAAYETTPLLNGTFTANAWWDAGAIIVNDLDWNAPGVHVRGDATRNADGTMACHIEEATANADAIAALYALWPLPGATVKTQEDAEVRIRDAMLGTTTTDRPRFVRGDATFRGFDLVLADGTKALTNIHGRVDVDEGVLRVKEIAADDVSITGKATPDLDTGRVAFDLTGTMELSLPRLLMVEPAAPIQDLQGSLTFTRITGIFVPERNALPKDLLVECGLDQGRVAVAWPGRPEPAVFGNLRGKIRFEQGKVAIADLKGDDVSVAGSVKPDWTNHTVALRLSGTAALNQERLRAFVPLTGISDVAGTVTFKQVKATLEPRGGIPADLEIEGELREGRASVTSGFTDALSQVSGSFGFHSGQAEHDLQGDSERFGPFTTAGRYTLASRRWEGTVSCDAGRAVVAFLGPRADKPMLSHAISAYGMSSFAASLVVSGDGVTIQATREGEPALRGHVSLVLQEGGWNISSIEVSAALPLEVIKPVLPPAISVDGTADVDLHQDALDQAFTLRANLSQSTIAAGEYLKKRKGDNLAVEVRGSAWVPQSATITCLGVAIPLRIEEQRVVVENFDVDLVPLTLLLPEGGVMSGRVRGTFATSPVTLDLVCDHVAFTLNSQVRVDSITGDIAYADGHVTCRDLTVRGANSDCTITAGQKGAAWQGRITGKKFDLNAVLAMASAMKALRTSSGQGKEATPAQGITGAFSFDLESAFFRRARLDNVRADVEMTPEVIRVRNFSGRPYSGALTGTIDIVPARDPVPGSVQVHLKMDSIDGRFLDEILFAEPRGLAGAFSGNVSLQAPNRPGEEAMAGASGDVSFAAREGSFGKMGFATQILSAIKSADFIRLRMPSFKDEGLTFTTCAGSFSMRKGVLTLQQTSLVSPPFTMEAQGAVDFPRKNTNVVVHVGVLESVAGLTERIPVIGGAVSTAASVAGVELHVEGSPYNPTVRVQPLRRVGGIPKKVGEKAIDLLDKTIDRIRGR